MFDKIMKKVSDKKDSVVGFFEDMKFWKKEMTPIFKNHWGKMLMVIPTIFLILWASFVWIMKTDEIVVITGKETKVTDVVMVEKKAKNGSIVEVPKNVDTYFVSTDKGAFQYKTSWVFLQIEVADSFGKLQEGKTYRLTHYGFRVPILDWYENIVDFEQLDPKTLEPIEK